MGPEWSAGQLGNRSIGARKVAHELDMCLGPYATHAVVHLHPMGHNTHDEGQASSRQPREEDQSANQLAASSLRKPTGAKDCASLAIAALHPPRPLYSTRGLNDDVHIWALIVNR